VAPIGTPEKIIRKVSEDLRKVVTDPDLKKKIATRGSYTRAMLPAEAITFVQAEQRRWKPVLELIANKTNRRRCGDNGPGCSQWSTVST